MASDKADTLVSKAPSGKKALEARGGVSPTPNRPAASGYSGAVQELSAQVPSGAAPVHSTFSYHGGPVVNCALVNVSFWGSAWTTDPTHLARAARLAQYHKDLVSSNFMNVLNQYGVGKGIFVNTSFFSNVKSDLSGTDIQTILQGAINSGALAEPSNGNTCVIVYLAEGISVHDGSIVMCAATSDDAFGFHSFFTTTAGHPLNFAIIPGLEDNCLKSSCPGGDGSCSLKLTETQEQRQTQVASHEFAEMTTDPQLNAWFEGSSGGENGDLCNGESATITIGANTWTVQKTYSKANDTGAPGAVFCLSEAAAPIPKLPGAPSSVGADILAANVLPHDRLLPLPAIHFDAEAGTHRRDAAEIQAYVRRVFSPLPHGLVVGDLVPFLREVADVMEKATKV
jgi:hypothetical protein